MLGQSVKSCCFTLTHDSNHDHNTATVNMGVLWLLNLVLIAFPVCTTVGVLLGVQTHRVAIGKPPLFVDNGIKSKSYCQKTLGISPPSKGDHYTRKRTLSHRFGSAMRMVLARSSQDVSR